MKQDEIKLEITKKFIASLEVKEGSLITTLDEDNYYEFKQSLSASKTGISKKYIKTIAGFANNKGGLLIFGIHPDTKELIGIKDKFENLDNKLVNTTIMNHLDGLSSYFFFTYRHENKLIGFLQIDEPVYKPTIVKTGFEVDKENYVAGDIYYRYPGEDLKIKPSDLRTLMTSEINRHAQLLVKQINTLVDIGPENAAIINSQTGEVNARNAKLVMSPEMLGELNLIMEGRFVETDGAPAYIIKGNISLEDGQEVSKIIKEKVHSAIHNRDYHLSLLDGECNNPENLIRDVVYRDTSYLPIFNLLNQSNISTENALELVSQQNSPDVKKATKNKIIERLETPETCRKLGESGTVKSEIEETEITDDKTISKIKEKYNLKGNLEKSIARSVILNNLKNISNIPVPIKKKYLKEYVEAFTHLDKETVIANKDFYCSQLKSVLTDNAEDLRNNSATKTSFRKTLCYMDYLIYSGE